MRLYAALDVSMKKTAVCVMDHDGGLVREAGVPTCPDALAELLRAYEGQLERVGLEAGPLPEWLVRGLAGHGIEAVLIETRQARKALSAMTVKTDRNDARGLAHLLRTGWFRPVHVKTVSAREQRARLSARETLVRQLRGLENWIASGSSSCRTPARVREDRNKELTSSAYSRPSSPSSASSPRSCSRPTMNGSSSTATWASRPWPRSSTRRPPTKPCNFHKAA